MNRRVLVTGAASGIGLATAQCFAAAGDRVLMTDVDGATLATAAAAMPGGVAPTLVLDVTSEQSWKEARTWCEQQWGGLDVLVNNAGVAAGGLFERIPEQDWDWIVAINLMGVVRGCRTFVPLLKQQRRGHVVNVASMAGLLNMPAMSSYNVTKAGVVALSETLHHELGPWNVGVSVVCPEFLATNLVDRMRTPDAAALAFTAKVMEAATVTADDVAAKIVDAVADDRFLVLTHRGSPWFHRLKRLAPGVWDRAVARRWTSISRRFDTPAPPSTRPSSTGSQETPA